MKRDNPNVLFTLATVIGVLVVGGAGAVGQESEKEQPGRAEYVEMGCYQCHGYEGQGGGGPLLAPDPLPWEAFALITRKPPNVMPAYSPKVLTDEELDLIYEFVKSIPPTPEVSSIPILAAEE